MAFEVHKDQDKQVVIIRVEGQLLVGNRKELQQHVTHGLESGDRKFLIDFTPTGFIDSSGLAALMALSNEIREAGGELRLAGLNDDLRAMVDLTKLNVALAIDDMPEGALAAF